MPTWLTCILTVLGGWTALGLLIGVTIGKSIKKADEMARKAKHDQKTIPDSGWVCTHCKGGHCNRCTDVMRIALGLGPPLCQCKKKDHAGEPRDKQIVDPETGTVWAPGLRITKDGEVFDGGLDD